MQLFDKLEKGIITQKQFEVMKLSNFYIGSFLLQMLEILP
jgi:hypothetical protein